MFSRKISKELCNMKRFFSYNENINTIPEVKLQQDLVCVSHTGCLSFAFGHWKLHFSLVDSVPLNLTVGVAVEIAVVVVGFF